MTTFFYNAVSHLFRHSLRFCYQLCAKLFRRSFVCNALQGESEYNISLNCDMTVSCNCQDDGSGILGSLDESSFEEIFFGPKANAFRASLAKGKLPILTCARCSELRFAIRDTLKVKARTSRSLKALKRTEAALKRPDGLDKNVETSCSQDSLNGGILKNEFNDLNEQSDLTTLTPRLPHCGMLLENTIACNLRCPGCIRPEVAKIRKKNRMSLEDVRKVSKLIQRLGLKKLFYFNRGEPFLSPDILEELKIIRALNPNVHIVTSTNGMFLDTDEKREAALLMDEVTFSIDGCDQESLQKYQRGGDFKRALKNLRDLVRFRDARGLNVPQIEWKYLLFNWNDRPRQIAKAICLARGQMSEIRCQQSALSNALKTQEITGAGADVISFWPTNNPFYGISWRYRLGFLNRIGEKSWKGREVCLRPADGRRRTEG